MNRVNIYNPWEENVSGFFHKDKIIPYGTKKFKKIMKKWRKNRNSTIGK